MVQRGWAAVPADTELRSAQDFTAQAKQNLPEAGCVLPVRGEPVTFAAQTSPINLTTTATAFNNNIVKLDLGSLRSDSAGA